MILGIDASNIRSGGGITHLSELLRAANPNAYGFSRVIIWLGKNTEEKIENREWLCKVNEPYLNRCLPYRIFWKCFKLKNLAKQAGCNILFIPGGSDISGFKPIVTMSQNLLPFEWREMRRFGLSFYTLKFLLLRVTQSITFRRAEGVIFLTEYARKTVLKVTGKIPGKNLVIPHGINPSFFQHPHRKPIKNKFDFNHPFRLLYVSIIDVYKHQWNVAEAVALLRADGFPVVLELIGPPAKGMKRLKKALNHVDPERIYITYRGAVPHEELYDFYSNADIGIFASSCENMPNILIEGMAAGLTMACSSLGPMPEILGDAGIYFDPENKFEIASAVRKLLDSYILRDQLAQSAFDKSLKYSWKRCADDTFNFLAEIAHKQI